MIEIMIQKLIGMNSWKFLK